MQPYTSGHYTYIGHGHLPLFLLSAARSAIIDIELSLHCVTAQELITGLLRTELSYTELKYIIVFGTALH